MVGPYAEACGVMLSAETPVEVLLTVVSVPLDVVLQPAPEPQLVPPPDPTIAPGASPSPSPAAEPSAAPTPEASPSPDPDPDVPVPLLLGPEPLAVPLLPSQGAGLEDAYRIVVIDPVALEPLLEVELVLPLCVPPPVEPSPSGSPSATPTSTATGDAAGSPEPSGSPDPSASPGPSGSPGPTPAAPAPPSVEQAVNTSAQVVAAPPRRAIGRLSAPPLSALRARTRAGASGRTTAPLLPELAGTTDDAVPAPVVAYPPGTTGVLLPTPPDRPLALLLPLQTSAGAPAQAVTQRVTLAHGGPPPGVADALPAALLAAAAAAGFLATQLRRRVPLRRS